MYNLRPRKNTPSYQFSDEEESASDSDYEPESDYETESDTDSEMTDYDIADLGRNYRLSSSAPEISYTLLQKYTSDEKNYLLQLKKEERVKIELLENNIHNTISKDLIPLRFKILMASMDDTTKRIILNKLNTFTQMTDTSSGEYFKLKNWLDNVSHLPFDKYVTIPITYKDPMDKITTFMNETKESLDKTVYGHVEAKQQILRILAQWISNPNSYGHCIAIHGPMGIGKTSLIKEGLAKALKIPFGFIALGGASDGSFLEGHSYTYEGSTYGKIAEMLIKTQCSNPILFFDELDKVSLTKKGEEIIGILTHLTDATQNEKFNDKYFGEIDLNLSKSLIIFSYNNDNAINPILKDRLITIKVEGYKKAEKIIIAKNYLLPDIYKNFGFSSIDIILEDKLIDLIIELVPEEQGVRNLKRGLETIISWINMYRFTNNKNTFPFTVTEQFIHKHLQKNKEETYTKMYS
jgi:ATP-dependent Lon protease